MRGIIVLIAFIIACLYIAYNHFIVERFTIKQEVYEPQITSHAKDLGLDVDVKMIETKVYDSREMNQCIHSQRAIWDDNAKAERKKAMKWIESYLELEELNKSLE